MGVEEWFYKNAIDEDDDSISDLMGRRNSTTFEKLDIFSMKPKLIKNARHFIYQVTKGRFGKRRNSFKCKIYPVFVDFSSENGYFCYFGHF